MVVLKLLGGLRENLLESSQLCSNCSPFALRNRESQ